MGWWRRDYGELVRVFRESQCSLLSKNLNLVRRLQALAEAEAELLARSAAGAFESGPALEAGEEEGESKGKRMERMVKRARLS